MTNGNYGSILHHFRHTGFWKLL